MSANDLFFFSFYHTKFNIKIPHNSFPWLVDYIYYIWIMLLFHIHWNTLIFTIIILLQYEFNKHKIYCLCHF